MAIPWLRLIDVAFGLNDVVRQARGAGAGRSRSERSLAAPVARQRDARLASVMMGALKEVFDRDSTRNELERQRVEEERLRAEEQRQRAERALRLELLRQAGDREIERARTLLIAALVTVVGLLVLFVRSASGTGGKVSLGLAVTALLVSIAVSSTEQGRISRLLALGDDRLAPERLTGGSTSIALGLLLAGLALACLTVLLA
jgi:hypothetical protein